MRYDFKNVNLEAFIIFSSPANILYIIANFKLTPLLADETTSNITWNIFRSEHNLDLLIPPTGFLNLLSLMRLNKFFHVPCQSLLFMVGYLSERIMNDYSADDKENSTHYAIQQDNFSNVVYTDTTH